ncbi:hypothetical protein CQA40_07705 [Helicobacter sp. MIT 01-3238]|nr:hypothetical protein CQA40_07705 [Helicobacter sp. MIT 01-3238]
MTIKSKARQNPQKLIKSHKSIANHRTKTSKHTLHKIYLYNISNISKLLQFDIFSQNPLVLPHISILFFFFFFVVSLA